MVFRYYAGKKIQLSVYLPRFLYWSIPSCFLFTSLMVSSLSLFLTLDYFADLQGRVDDDPGVYWEFYGSAVCGEYHFHTRTRTFAHSHTNRCKKQWKREKNHAGRQTDRQGDR